jgi:hypothetical protein
MYPDIPNHGQIVSAVENMNLRIFKNYNCSSNANAVFTAIKKSTVFNIEYPEPINWGFFQIITFDVWGRVYRNQSQGI